MNALAISIILILVASFLIPFVKQAFKNPLDKHFE